MTDDFTEKLYNEYFGAIAAYCTSMLDGDESEGVNCAQDVFLQVMKDKDMLRRHPNIVGWLKKTAKNRVMRSVREKQRRQKNEVHITDLSEKYLESAQYVEEYDENFVSDSEIARMKEDILARLTEEERRLYDLRFVQNLTFGQIGPLIGLSESASRMRCVRLELHIREMVADMFK